MFRSLPLIAALSISAMTLAACGAGQDPDPLAGLRAELPVSARLGPTALGLVYTDRTTCEVRPPAGLVPGESWSDGFVSCPGVTAVEVVLWDTAPEAVILRIADAEGPLTLTDLPPLALAEVWAAAPGGIWAHFTARP